LNAEQRGSPAKNLAFTSYSLVTLVIVASYLFIHLLGYGFFFLTPEGLVLSMRSFSFPVLILFVLGFNTPDLSVGAVFLFVWILYGLCFIVAWKWRKAFHAAFKKSASKGLHDVFSNFLFAMPLLSSMVLTAALAIIYSQSAVGIETGVPQLPSDPHEAFLDLAYAPVIEEVAFRLVPIGILMVVYVFALGKPMKELSASGNRLKLFSLALFYPEGAKKMAGLPNVDEHGILKGISSLEWLMIAVTSVIFGLAHLLPPNTWEVGKITSAFVQGGFFAVAYVAYGFEAPILLHWYFNYYFYFFDPAIAEGFFPTTIGVLSIIEIMLLMLGIVGWVVFTVVGLHKLMQSRKQPSQPPLQPLISPS